MRLPDRQVARALREAGFRQSDLDLIEECESREDPWAAFDDAVPADRDRADWTHLVSAGDYIADLAKGLSVSFADSTAYHGLRDAHSSLHAARDELRAGEKVSCWLWWVLPTDRPGMNDPLQTYLTRVTALELLKEWPDGPLPESGFPQWRAVLEHLGSLVGRVGMRRLLPGKDVPRVRDFVKFWRSIRSKPYWLEEVLRRLAGWLQLLD